MLDTSHCETPRDYAHAYVDAGWAVLLLSTDSSGGKIPPRNCPECSWRLPDGSPNPDYRRHTGDSCDHLLCHGFYAATTDKERLNQMFAALPSGHVAVRTGQASRILVLDAEAYGQGDDPSGLDVLESWQHYAQVDWDLPPTLRSKSVSGGLHLFYRLPPGVEIMSGRPLPGVDVKAEAGYVGVPSGKSAREWIPGTELVDAPPELLEWLKTVRRMGVGGGGTGGMGKPAGYDYLQFLVHGCPGGHRDFFFNDLAFRLRKRGVTYDEYFDELHAAWEKCEQPPAAEWYMPWHHVEYKLSRVWALVEADPPSAGLAWAKKIEKALAQRLASAAPVSDADTVGALNGGDDGDRVGGGVGSGGGGGGSGVPPSPLTVGHLRYPDDHWYGVQDDGTADRLNDVWGDWFRALPRARGGYSWIYFDGTTWQPDSRDLIWNAMSHVVSLVDLEVAHWERRCEELAAEGVDDWRTALVGGTGQNAGEFSLVVSLRKYRAECKNIGRKETGVRSFARLEHMTIAEEDLDANTRYVGMRDGRVLDVRAIHEGRGREEWIRPAAPEMLLTKKLGCGYVAPDAGVPGTLYEFSKFREYLENVLPDRKVRDTLQEIVGYALLGEPNEKIIVLLHGPPDSGKTVLLEVLEALFGDYGGWTDGQALIAGKAKSAHSEWLHKMRGLRVIMTPETAKGAKIDAAWMKSYTGREPQSTRGAYGDKTVVWKPSGIIFNASNHYLEYDAEDTAVAERTQVIEFEQQFLRGDPRRDDALPRKIREGELPVVLNWAIAGLVRHGSRKNAAGVRSPHLVIASKIAEWSKRYRIAQDHVGQFITDALADGKLIELPAGESVDSAPASTFVPCKIVYELYKTWCVQEMRKPIGRNTFNKHLKLVYGFRDVDSAGRRWRGYTSPLGDVTSVYLVQW